MRQASSACAPRRADAPQLSLADLPALALVGCVDARSLAALSIAAPRSFRELADAEAEARLRARWPGAAAAAATLRGSFCSSLLILSTAAPSVAAGPPARCVFSPPWCREVEAWARAARRRGGTCVELDARCACGAAVHDAAAGARHVHGAPLPRAMLAAFQRAALRGDVTAAEALSFLQRGWRAVAAALGSPSAWARAPRAHPLDFVPQREAARRGHLPSLLAYGGAWLTGFAALVPRALADGALDVAVAMGPSHALLLLRAREPRVAHVLLSAAVGMSIVHDGTPSAEALMLLGRASELALRAAVMSDEPRNALMYFQDAVAAYDACGMAGASRLAARLAPPWPEVLLASRVVRALDEVPSDELACAQPARRGVLLARLMGVDGDAPVTLQQADACRAAMRALWVSYASRYAAPDGLASVLPDHRASVASPEVRALLQRLDEAAATRSRRQRRDDAAPGVPEAPASRRARRWR